MKIPLQPRLTHIHPLTSSPSPPFPVRDLASQEGQLFKDLNVKFWSRGIFIAPPPLLIFYAPSAPVQYSWAEPKRKPWQGRRKTIFPIPSRHGALKGTVAWDGFVDHSIVSKIESRAFKFFSKKFKLVHKLLIWYSQIQHFLMRKKYGYRWNKYGRTLASFSVFGECAKIFQDSCELHGVNISTMGDGILYHKPQQNKMQLKFLACPTGEISLCVFSLCAQWVKSCPNSGNIDTTWKKFKILSFYPR